MNANVTKTTAPTSGRDFYAEYYRSGLERQARWLEYGAIEKANSISKLIERNGVRPRHLLELGCGTGAVIIECKRRGLAQEYTAVDFSPEAIRHLKSHEPSINCVAADITDERFSLKEHFDVIVLSHVLEHLEEPLPFLQAIRKRFDFESLIVEVPLEDLLIARVKGLISDRRKNSAGHVQFFSGTAFKSLMHSAGFEIHDQRRFVPRMSAESIRFVSAKLPKLRTAMSVCTTCYLPTILGPIWKEVWYAHLAVRCTPIKAH